MKQSACAWKPAESALLNARRILPELLRDYFKSGRKLRKNSPAKSMHRFRLKTKHLRYTMEVFTPLFDSEFESRMQTLRPIQNALGDLNDCEVMLNQFGKKLPRTIQGYVQKRGNEKRQEFLRYWREEFDATGEEKKWEQYLTRTARSQPAARTPARTPAKTKAAS